MGEAVDTVGCSPEVGVTNQVISELKYHSFGSMLVRWGGCESHLKKVYYKEGGVEGEKGGRVASASVRLLVATGGISLKSVGIGLKIL